MYQCSNVDIQQIYSEIFQFDSFAHHVHLHIQDLVLDLDRLVAEMLKVKNLFREKPSILKTLNVKLIY